MVGNSRQQDAEDDGTGLTELGREQKGQQLGLVANFGEGDHACRKEECFHGARGEYRTPQGAAMTLRVETALEGAENGV